MQDADAETRAMATNIRTGDESDDEMMAADDEGGAGIIGTPAGGLRRLWYTCFIAKLHHILVIR